MHLSNYASKKELEHATEIDTSELATKKYFIALKAVVNKLDINKMTNVPTSLNNVDDVDVGKLKNVLVDLKKSSDVVDCEVVKNTKLKTLKTKVNNFEMKIPDATTLIHVSPYNTDKQNLEKKVEMLIKNIRYELMETLDYEKKMFCINFTKANTKCWLSLHYNADNSYFC